MKVNPTRLLIEDTAIVENTTKSGLIIPNQVVKVDTMRGVVIVAGEGTDELKMVWNVGDTVLFNPRAGQKVKYNDKEYRLIDLHEVLLGGI